MIHSLYQGYLIDAAARRGFLEIVKILHKNLVKPSPDTLACGVLSGNPEVVEYFLSIGCSVADIGPSRLSPLGAVIRIQDSMARERLREEGAFDLLENHAHLSSAVGEASEVGDVAFLELMVDHGMHMHPQDLGIALMAVITAKKEGQDKLAYRLIEAGAFLESRPSTQLGQAPLLQALKRRDEKLVVTLLDAGADPNNSLVGSNLYQPDVARKSALNVAVQWGNMTVLKRLIFEGAEVNSGQCNLRIAIEKEDNEALTMLLDAGADPNRNREGVGRFGSPLAAATAQGSLSGTQLMLDHGANPNDPEALRLAYVVSMEIFDLILKRYHTTYRYGKKGFGRSFLTAAILEGNEEQIKTFLKHGMDPFTLDGGFESTSPLGTAICTDHPKRNTVVAILLGKIFDVNSVVVTRDYGYDRRTALVAAIGTKDQSLVLLLVQRGADVNFLARGHVIRTPLQEAAALGDHEMVEFLIHLNADVNAPPGFRDGGTALQLVARSGFLRTVSILLGYKAEVNAPASKGNGRTALEGAAENGRLDAVMILLKAGAAKSDKPQFDRACKWARDNGHFHIVELLEEHEHALEQHGKVYDEATGVYEDDTFMTGYVE